MLRSPSISQTLQQCFGEERQPLVQELIHRRKSASKANHSHERSEDVSRRSLWLITLQKKPLCLHKMSSKKAFDGMKCPACNPPPHTSHYLRLLLPAPQDLLNLGILSQSLEERERSAGGEGVSGPPLCHCICPERGYSLRQGLRRMTLVSHKVMGDNRLVYDDGC
ncbi:hypothetical protein FQN60_015187, partial [Etheostoma spectabile]